MEIRRHQSGDLAELACLFGETVRSVCAGDYTAGQIEAWAAGEADLLERDPELSSCPLTQRRVEDLFAENRDTLN